MEKLRDSFFKAYFSMPVPRIIVRTDSPDYTIVAINPAYELANGISSANLEGTKLSGLITENLGQLWKALEESRLSNTPAEIEEFELSVVNDHAHSKLWWHIEVLPVAETGFQPGYLVISIRDITQELLSKKELEKHDLLNTVIDEVPAGIVIFRGPDMIIDKINTKLLQMWKRGYDIVGRPLVEVLPEIKDQEFPKILEEVYRTGKPYQVTESMVELVIDGVRQTAYRDFSYTPLKDKHGNTHRIVALSVDVTERTLGRQREQQLLEEYTAINEELTAANEELATTNEELHEFQETQLLMNQSLAESESRFRNLVMEAPLAICILKGNDQTLETINSEGLNIFGKTPDIVGKPLKESLPELEVLPFLTLLKGVYRSGKTFYGNEIAASFEQQGILKSGHYSFICKPIKTDQGLVESIMVVATDVTETVKSRREKENAEANLSLAVEAAQMGSWHIDPLTKELYCNPGLLRLFGYEREGDMTFDDAIGQVTEEYRTQLLEVIENAIATGGSYDMTYLQRRFNDGEPIWIRSLGKISADENGNHTIFSGIVMDVTEQKVDEQRKNDFIGMVSHELKTPLTTLKGYAQILHSRAAKAEDQFSMSALAKVNDQVKKMTELINGFLNISRLESGKIHLNKQEFNLDELVNENIEEATLVAASHQINFIPCDSVIVYADREKVSSVIANLISNAIKYSPGSDSIEVRCEVIGQCARFSVRDWGLGINAEDQPKLFDRFYRVESKETQLISGFGIGLYLSAEIIERHGGRIWVESEVLQGSVFFFELPLHTA